MEPYRLMGEHPVRVQPKLVMPRPPRRRHRAGLLENQRIKAGPADRPRGSKPRRPRPDHHNTLIHAASVAAGSTPLNHCLWAFQTTTAANPGKNSFTGNRADDIWPDSPAHVTDQPFGRALNGVQADPAGLQIEGGYLSTQP